jgi:hypothetical protein
MALKRTSEPITISKHYDASVRDAFAVNEVDLQLNPLDREVFVVTAVKIDFMTIPFPDSEIPATAGPKLGEYEVSIFKTRPLASSGVGNSNVVASSSLFCLQQLWDGPTAVGMDYSGFTLLEQTPSDTPPVNMEYLDIIATDNFFVTQFSQNINQAIGTGPAVNIRVHGYRAQADAATYAALVQSEALSN